MIKPFIVQTGMHLRRVGEKLGLILWGLAAGGGGRAGVWFYGEPAAQVASYL